MRFSLVAAASVFLFSVAMPPAFAADATPQPDITAPIAKLPPNATPDAPKGDPDQFLMQAKDAYKGGEFKKSLDLIDKAQTAIRSQRLELYRPLLPTTPENWQADDGNDSQVTLDAAMIGGMSVISRKYTGYGHTIRIGYIVDSPMMNFLGNIMKMVGTMQGAAGSMESVQGNQAIYKESVDRKGANSHELMIMAGDVTVVLQSETLPKETILQFANIIPFEKLKTVK